ncbi:MAG: response regulator [Pirellulales bacterium]
MEYILSEFPHGGNRFYTAIVRDISERKKYEEERRQRRRELEREVERKTQTIRESKRKIEETYQKLESEQRLKDTFLLALTHETNNLLVPIMGHATALARKMADDPMVVDRSNKIRRSSERIQQLSNECKNYQKLVMGKVDLTPVEFDLSELIRGIAEQLEERATKNESRIVLEGVDALGKIVSDQERITQILTNLVGNACKFTKQGTITIAAQRLDQNAGNFVRIDVRDTGVGMSPEQADRLFKPFPMISTKEQNPDGTGLGLALCKDLCRILGGDISASSEQGVGSTFSVVLPIELRLEKNPESAAEEHHVSTLTNVLRPHANGDKKSRRVLVIDDDPNVCDLMREFLENHGMVISTAHDGQTGLEMARTQKPDVITLDAMMPNMDGWTVLTLLKSDPQTQRIPVVMVTVADDRKRGVSLGVSDYFTKPIDWPRLTRMLQDYTGGEAAPRVLVIDDQPGTREMCRETLAGNGWIVVEASDGVSGLAQVEAANPSVILLDLLMPNMDGFEFLEELRARPDGAKIPVVVMTAKDLTDEDRLRLNARVAGVIMKGRLSTDELLQEMLQRVKSILETRSDRTKEVSVG